MKQNFRSMAGNFCYLFHELYSFQRDSVFLPFLGSALQISLSLIVIWIPKIVLDLIESKADLSRLLWGVTASGVILLFVSVANTTVHNRIDSCAQVFLFTVLKAKWEEKMMDLDYEVFSSPVGKRKAEKARNAVSNPNFGVVAYLGRMTKLLESAGGLLALSTMICILHPLILVLLFLMFGIEFRYGVLSETRKHMLQEERAQANRKLNYIAYHTRGIQEGKDIRVYSMTGWLRKAAEEAVADKDQVETRTSRQDFKKMVLNGIFIFLRNGCAYAYLIWQYSHGGMTVGDFTLSFSAVTGLGSFLSQLAQGISDFIEADNYVTDFREFMETGCPVPERRQPFFSPIACAARDGITGCARQYSADTLTKPISFIWENVSFSYWEEHEDGRREIPVLKNISLTIQAGEKLAIVGVNGAGKTTFVKLLCGLLRPTEGRILINGMDGAEFEGEDYRRLFSAVFQKSGVLPVSIRDNITLSADSEETEFCEREVWSCIRRANLEEKVRSLPEGLDTPLVKQITEHGMELSGGERQRLLLARALYKNAPVLILDEPTAALDPIAENEIYCSYNRLTEGRTSVFISHRLASTRFCDRILVMEKGEIVEAGTHEGLMEQNGRYAEMFRIQSRYYGLS